LQQADEVHARSPATEQLLDTVAGTQEQSDACAQTP
jgi:hypothetical protein